jgi:hypothetical protein
VSHRARKLFGASPQAGDELVVGAVRRVRLTPAPEYRCIRDCGIDKPTNRRRVKSRLARYATVITELEKQRFDFFCPRRKGGVIQAISARAFRDLVPLQ